VPVLFQFRSTEVEKPIEKEDSPDVATQVVAINTTDVSYAISNVITAITTNNVTNVTDGKQS
jgi:hypothetical protein